MLSGYRIGYHSFGEIFKTCFKCHNETTNIWTHFVGAVAACATAIVILIYCHDTESVGYDGLRLFRDWKSKEPSLDMTQFITQRLNTFDQEIQIFNKVDTKYRSDKLVQVETLTETFEKNALLIT